jgi:flagellar protein FliO/FliZ
MYRHQFYILVGSLALVLFAGAGGFPLGAQQGAAPGEAGSLAAAPDERDIRLGEESPGVPVAVPGPVSSFVILRTVLLLILAAAAVYGVVHVAKKLSRPRDALSPDLRVLASTRLGPNRFVHVVALGTQAWLVGAGEGGISCIAEVRDQEALDSLLLEESRRIAAAGSGRPMDFASLLRRLGAAGSGGPGRAGPEAPEREAGPGADARINAENIRARRDRLRGL